jgi:hypothetical protein
VRCNTGSLGTPRDRLQSDRTVQHDSRSYGDQHAPTHPLHAYTCKCSGSFGNYSSVVCRVCLSVSPGARALSLSPSLSLSLCACTSVFLKARMCACVCGGGLVTSLLLLYVDTLDAFIRRRRVNDCTHRSTHARRHNTSDTVIPPHIRTQHTQMEMQARALSTHTHTHTRVHAPSYTHAHHVRTSRRTPAAPHAA